MAGIDITLLHIQLTIEKKDIDNLTPKLESEGSGSGRHFRLGGWEYFYSMLCQVLGSVLMTLWVVYSKHCLKPHDTRLASYM